jgi:ketosteroid isomerase-like protein
MDGRVGPHPIVAKAGLPQFYHLLILSVFVLLPCLQARAGEVDDATAIRAADQQFAADTKKRGLEGWVAWFAETGAMGLGPEQAPAVGRDAIRKAMAKAFARKNFSIAWKPELVQVQVPGKIGTSTGRWQTRFQTKTGTWSEQKGTYLSVWHRQKDGSWKVVYDIGAPDEGK